MEKADLLLAIKNSGGAEQGDDEVEGLLAKLKVLSSTGRYATLLRNIERANDRGNFLASVLEAHFAYQFEAKRRPLAYEVKQDPKHESSIDFMRQTDNGASLYFELRLHQQDSATRTSIRKQLETSPFYSLAMTGDDVHDAIVRLQTAALEKVQSRNGVPIKFLTVERGKFNIIVLDVTEIISGTIDEHDCELAAHGDPGVAEVYRFQIFGLFQQPLAHYPERIQQLARRFERIRNVVHAVMFLFRSRGGGLGVINYSLEQCIMFNPALVDRPTAEQILRELAVTLPVKTFD